MFSPKSNLYRSEWLELLFYDRNKGYGAYDLRKNYANNLSKALGITSFAFIGLFLGFHFFLTRVPAPERAVVVTLTNRVIAPPEKVKPVDPPKPRIEPPVQHRSVAFPPPVLAEDNVAKNPPTLEV